MKKIVFLIFLFVAQFCSAQLTTKERNTVKVKYQIAQNLLEEKDYAGALKKIKEAEDILQNQKLPNLLNLKVKILVAKEDFEEANKQLDTLNGLKLSNSILNDIAIYSLEIEKGLEEIEKERKKQELIKEQKRIEIQRDKELESLRSLIYQGVLFIENRTELEISLLKDSSKHLSYELVFEMKEYKYRRRHFPELVATYKNKLNFIDIESINLEKNKIIIKSKKYYAKVYDYNNTLISSEWNYDGVIELSYLGHVKYKSGMAKRIYDQLVDFYKKIGDFEK